MREQTVLLRDVVNDLRIDGTWHNREKFIEDAKKFTSHKTASSKLHLRR